MIPKDVPLWRKIQRTNFTSVDKLSDFLQLTSEQKQLLDPTPSFVLNLPVRLAEKIKKATLHDPILRQFVPLKQEREKVAGFTCDPVCDLSFQKEESKILHKYESRALIVTTSACAMNCRFCFRKNFPYETERKDFSEEIRWIQKNPSIKEVIISGGDPLSLSDEHLKDLFDAIDAIDHVKRIRFHTRFPIGIPERIDDGFLELLSQCKKQIWFILHSNHPNEFDADIWKALKKIQRQGIPVLNQAVLLKGVNDSKELLQQFFEQLVDQGVQPYYLHQLDRVEGAHHFEVTEEKGAEIMAQLQKTLSGYAVPRYVREVPGEPGKTEIVSLK